MFDRDNAINRAEKLWKANVILRIFLSTSSILTWLHLLRLFDTVREATCQYNNVRRLISNNNHDAQFSDFLEIVSWYP